MSSFNHLTTNRGVLQFVQVNQGGKITTWEECKPKTISIRSPVRPIIVTAVDVEEELVVVGLQSGHLIKININNASQMVLEPLHTSQITAVCLAKDSKLYAGDVNGIVSVYPQKEWRGKILKYALGSITSLTINNEKVLVGVEYGTFVQAFDKTNGELIRTWPKISTPPIHQIVMSSRVDCLIVAFDSQVVMYRRQDKPETVFTIRAEPYHIHINEWRPSRNILHIMILNAQGQIEIYRILLNTESTITPESEIIIPGYKIIYAQFTSSKAITIVYGTETPLVETVQYATSHGEIIKGTIYVQPKQPVLSDSHNNKSTPKNESEDYVYELSFGERLQNRPVIPKKNNVDEFHELFLLHAIQSGDNVLREKLFNVNDETLITKSVKKLSPPSAVTLLNISLAKFLDNPSNTSAAKWIKEVLVIHAAHLITVSSINSNLTYLEGIIKNMMEDYADFFRLKGRMDLVIDQIESKKHHDNEMSKKSEESDSEKMNDDTNPEKNPKKRKIAYSEEEEESSEEEQ